MSKLFSKAASALQGAGGAHSGGSDDEGESLTTVLRSHEDQMALTLLVADCTDAMRQAIVDVFDANEVGTKTDLDGSVDADVSVHALQNDNMNPHEPTADQTVQEEQRQTRERQQRELAQREKELSEAEMQELKKAALHHWNEWRSNVIQRIGEVLNSPEEQTRREHCAETKKNPERAVSPPMKFPQRLDYDDAVDKKLRSLYGPIDTPLRTKPKEERALILHCLLLLLLSLEHYHAESRVLLLRISTSLDLPIDVLALDESKVARGLLAAAENMSANDETKKKSDDSKTSRRWKVGLATVGGAALIGITGGLAAPLLAAGVGTVMGGLGLAGTATAGYLGALAGSGVLVGGLFGAYGGRMTGKMMDQYAREVEDFAFEPVRPHHRPRKIETEFRKLRVGIGISGWLTKKEEVVDPWKVFGTQLESFALRWELESLMNLGNSLTTLVTSAAWGYAKTEIIKRTIFGALTAGLWPLAILKVSRVIDNPFAIANHRAQKAGEILADALINKAAGERPVTLVGYSLGGKVIFACLKALADRRAFGLVENAVLIGTPAPSKAADWRMVRTAVTGRLINVYSTNDYILGFLYRSHMFQLGVAGLQAVENVNGVENVNVSNLVDGHTKYRHATGPILRLIGFEDVDLEGLAEEEVALQEQDKQEEKERAESEAKAGDKDSQDRVTDEYVEKLAAEVEKKNEQSYVARAKDGMVSAGTSASLALEKARAQWRTRRAQGEASSATGSMVATTANTVAPGP